MRIKDMFRPRKRSRGPRSTRATRTARAQTKTYYQLRATELPLAQKSYNDSKPNYFVQKLWDKLKSDVNSLKDATSASGNGNSNHPCGPVFSYWPTYKIHAIIAYSLCEHDFHTTNTVIGEGDVQTIGDVVSSSEEKKSINRQEVKNVVRNVSKLSGSDTQMVLEKVADEISKLRQLESLRAAIEALNTTINTNINLAGLFNSKLEAELQEKREELQRFTATSSTGVHSNITSTNSIQNVQTPTTTVGKQDAVEETQRSDSDLGSDSDSSDDEKHN